ncbi:alkylhydroperoxidase-like protein [Rhodococcus ruber BKS 20-38]|uniref:Alkylhydroperoxidase-like protein n=1 Tax=Rhodococcus ruber BKS 20-38 TaxID=1278076 RepID=M2Y9D0_9NOCA|nr:carboxymuconolactone decarboxylase family protein [Rhodococcus ruber]EME51532.1 alkylhydroperoxidase-like protein [Rhodococcus ruber BKS 20-38]
MKTGQQVVDELVAPLKAFRMANPDLFRGYGQIQQAVMKDGKLSVKEKELMALAIAVATHCEGCIYVHAKNVAAHGASEEEVAETLSVCVQMQGGPGVVYAAKAFDAYREFAAA